MNVKIKCFFCILVLSFSHIATLSAEAISYQWQESKSEHFFVYYLKNAIFAKEIGNAAEEYYRSIASELGYPRYSDFWTWERRVKIYIYPDHASYLKATGQPSWSYGMADYTNKKIITYEFSKDFKDGLLPHEMTHLIFRDFVGFKGEVPLWLDEGVAQWEEPGKRKLVKEVIGNLYRQGRLIPLGELMKIDIRKIKADAQLDVPNLLPNAAARGRAVLGGEELVNIYYIEAVALVGFMIQTYGSLDFANFCRQLRDGKSLDDALRFAYGARLESVDELQKNWIRQLQ
jgi:hypothetical protein